MSLDELALILCDMYEMDEWLPNPVFDKKEFTRVSNTLWAIGEFRNYVANHIYPQTKTSIKNLEDVYKRHIMWKFSPVRVALQPIMEFIIETY